LVFVRAQNVDEAQAELLSISRFPSMLIRLCCITDRWGSQLGGISKEAPMK
jgi:hypothetical protein